MVHFGAKSAEFIWHACCISGVRKIPEGGSVSAFKCTCGAHHSQEDHDLDDRRLLEAAVMRALIPQEAVRRKFLAAVGASTANAALGAPFPFRSLQALDHQNDNPH